MVEDELEARTIEEAARKRKKRHKVLKTAGYAAGSVALFAAAWTTLPNLLSNVSGALYKSSLKKSNHDDDDDWKPVIEWEETPVEPEQPIETEEERPDGD